MLAAREEFETRVVPLVEVDGETVSSTRIRALVAAGDMEGARHCLGAPFMVEGEVVDGDQRGRELGFPTANIVPDDRLVIPGHGVYAAFANGVPSAVNVGVRPTFESGRGVLIETYLIDLEGDLYGTELRVAFVARLRGEKRFPGVEELIAQMRVDVEDAKRVCASFTDPVRRSAGCSVLPFFSQPFDRRPVSVRKCRRFSDRAETQARGDAWEAGRRVKWHGKARRRQARAAVEDRPRGDRQRYARARCSQVGAAQASTITIGSVLPLTYTLTPFGQPQTLFNTTLPETGAKLASPVDGAIVRWRMLGAKGGPFYLRVLQPNGSGAYQATAEQHRGHPDRRGSADLLDQRPRRQPATRSESTHATRPTKSGWQTVPGAGYAFIFPSPFNGATVTPAVPKPAKRSS